MTVDFWFLDACPRCGGKPWRCDRPRTMRPCPCSYCTGARQALADWADALAPAK